ncbi:hypothetical protein V3G71_09195 [Microbacterium paraoxydans]|uniref:hypothetical protein n=1 Tax=Microbacterium paraoxydans TaxID=199592 RepID=UPI002F26D224
MPAIDCHLSAERIRVLLTGALVRALGDAHRVAVLVFAIAAVGTHAVWRAA